MHDPRAALPVKKVSASFCSKDERQKKWLESLQRLAREEKRLAEGNNIGGPARDLLPKTGQQRITRLRLKHPSCRAQWQMSQEHHEIVIFLLLRYGQPRSIRAVLVVV